MAGTNAPRSTAAKQSPRLSREVAADVSPHEARRHQNGVKIPRPMWLPPLLGERAGVRASLSSYPVFRVIHATMPRRNGCKFAVAPDASPSSGYVFTVVRSVAEDAVPPAPKSRQRLECASLLAL